MRGRFDTTRWSVVRAAQEGSGTEAREALSTLCEAYWYPLWAFVRRQGYSPDEASDLTQGYFRLLLEKDYLCDVRRSAGKLRSFLITSLKHFLCNEFDRAQTLKRGGGTPILSLDAEEAEARYRLDPVDDMTPEKVFERRWALTVIERALERLQADLERSGRGEHFDRLKGFLVSGELRPPYRQVAQALGMSEGTVRVTVHRMRKKLGALLRAEVGDVVADDGDVEGELRHLLGVLAN